jgi:hypothetical protein
MLNKGVDVGVFRRVLREINMLVAIVWAEVVKRIELRR